MCNDDNDDYNDNDDNDGENSTDDGVPDHGGQGPAMHQPVARRPITGSVGNYYPQPQVLIWTLYTLHFTYGIQHLYS